jgi:hypothetical protein
MKGAHTAEGTLAFTCGIHKVQHNALPATADTKKWTDVLDPRFLATAIANPYDRCATVPGQIQLLEPGAMARDFRNRAR